jgi:hypothetical protein
MDYKRYMAEDGSRQSQRSFLFIFSISLTSLHVSACAGYLQVTINVS